MRNQVRQAPRQPPGSGRVESFLARAEILSSVAERLSVVGRLQRSYQDGLPAWLAAASRVCDFDQGAAVIVADHGAAATELRQSLPSVLKRLQHAVPAVTQLRITVNAANISAPPPRPRPQASPEAARALDELARQLPAGNLREAVERLARHHATGTARR